MWIKVDKCGDNFGKLGITRNSRYIMFIGEYTYSIDQKKRLAIPAKFRELLGKKAVITRGFDNCLFLYPLKEWKKRDEKLSNLSLYQADAIGLQRFMLAGAIEVSIDNLGRILVPDYLKKYGLLSKKVVIAGVSERIEIWDSKKWDEYKAKIEAGMGDMSERLGELGV